MGCMNLLGTALVGALAVLVALAPSSLAAKNDDPAKLNGQKQARDQGKGGDKGQGATSPSLPPGVSGSNSDSERPSHTNGDHGEVSGPGVNNLNPDKGQSNSEAGQPGAGGTGGSGETAGVHTCEKPNTSITIQVPEKGSSAQFGCTSGFTLYPKEANKVFSKDCKKQETLKDMTRTQASTPMPPTAQDTAGQAAAKDVTPPQASNITTDTTTTSPVVTNSPAQPPTPHPVVYTLKADNKPPKKRLCYLCAQQEVSELKPGRAEDYCIVYVDSGASTQLCCSLMSALVLPCVLALL